MFRSVLAMLALVCVILPVSASAESMKLYPVPTGGFALKLPSSWVDVGSLGAARLKQLEKVPTFKAFVQQASQNAALRLAAIDPAAKGNVYMDAGAVRVGSVSGTEVVAQTIAALKKSLGKKVSAVSTPVKLAAGTGYLLHLSEKGLPNETDEYLFVHDQIEYGIIYVAPRAMWPKYGPLFAASARSFQLLPAPNLSHVVLSGSQVGSGYKVAAYPFGNSIIGEATLDLCGASYPSEVLRTGRLQVRYTHSGAGVTVSNEVVTYVPGGAAVAMNEVTAVAKACAKKPAVLKQGGITETYKVALLKGAHVPQGAIAVRIQIVVTKGKKHTSQTGVAVYQVHGNTLSGLYTFVAKGTTFADAEKVGLHAAEQSAKNLGVKAHKSSGGGFTA
ncbi:MAG TPA: hypothetical protein VH063_02960 [Gaiellaceae bacterium]|jgi:hypothetical protein|nr:hypothetical protein [Gaiellaceae bacterium]